jgi:hypothetical protein
MRIINGGLPVLIDLALTPLVSAEKLLPSSSLSIADERECGPNRLAFDDTLLGSYQFRLIPRSGVCAHLRAPKTSKICFVTSFGIE